MKQAIEKTTSFLNRQWKPYSSYKPSGVEWLGEVPEHWKILPLRRVVKDFIDYRGQTPEKVEEGISLITARNVKEGFLDFSDSQDYISPELYKKWMVRGFPAVGDVIVTTEAPLGNVAQIIDDKVALAQRIILLKSDINSVENAYLKFYFLSLAGKGELHSEATGSTAEGIKASRFKALLVILPSLEEQKSIARFLDRETARIDTLINKKRQLIELLQKKRDAIVNQFITHGVDPAVSLRDSNIPWIGKVPDHWEVRRLKFIASSLSVGVVIQPSNYVEEDGEIPFILGSDISQGHINVENARRISRESNLKLKQTMLKANDLVCVRVGEPGVTAVVPPELDGINCASVMIIRQAKIFDSNWLCYVMNSTLGKANITLVAYGAAQKQFNISHAVDFLYPFPPSIEEQRKITDKLNQKLKPISIAIEKIGVQIEELIIYRKSLITAAVTGKIDVREEVN